jgi:succinyl-diaminopimelate desuccinylase
MDRTSQAVLLAQRLVQCPSVTPREGGALDLLEAELTVIGLRLHAPAIWRG